jgi:signal transduction histidine kinase
VEAAHVDEAQAVADLLRRQPLSTQSHAHVATIVESSGSVLRVLEDALDLARAEAGELAITSPIQAPFDGMSLTVMQRMEDGTVKVHNPPKPAAGAEKIAEAETGTGTEGAAQ